MNILSRSLGKSLVILKDNTGQKTYALREAAEKYTIIKRLTEKWRNGLPSDDVITLELLANGFNERAVKTFISVLRDTYDFTRLGGSAIMENEALPEAQMETNTTVQQPSTLTVSVKGSIGYTLSLSKGKEVRLLTPDSLSQQEFEFMLQWIKTLDLTKKEMNNGQDKAE